MSGFISSLSSILSWSSGQTDSPAEKQSAPQASPLPPDERIYLNDTVEDGEAGEEDLKEWEEDSDEEDLGLLDEQDGGRKPASKGKNGEKKEIPFGPLGAPSSKLCITCGEWSGVNPTPAQMKQVDDWREQKKKNKTLKEMRRVWVVPPSSTFPVTGGGLLAKLERRTSLPKPEDYFNKAIYSHVPHQQYPKWWENKEGKKEGENRKFARYCAAVNCPVCHERHPLTVQSYDQKASSVEDVDDVMFLLSVRYRFICPVNKNKVTTISAYDELVMETLPPFARRSYPFFHVSQRTILTKNLIQYVLVNLGSNSGQFRRVVNEISRRRTFRYTQAVQAYLEDLTYFLSDGEGPDSKTFKANLLGQLGVCSHLYICIFARLGSLLF